VQYGCRLPFGINAPEKDARGLIVGVLGDEFAPERFREDGVIEMIDKLARGDKLDWNLGKTIRRAHSWE
jgi:hypothetical protein